jgi:hypothetical protein
MTTLAITPTGCAEPARKARAPQLRTVLAFGAIWYGTFAAMLCGQALGLI